MSEMVFRVAYVVVLQRAVLPCAVCSSTYICSPKGDPVRTEPNGWAQRFVP